MQLLPRLSFGLLLRVRVLCVSHSCNILVTCLQHVEASISVAVCDFSRVDITDMRILHGEQMLVVRWKKVHK